jgi:signal transduction histidine kinase
VARWQEQLPLPIKGDLRRLGKALAVALGNAVQYSRASGTICVAVRVDGARVLISVHDRRVGYILASQPRNDVIG